MDALIYTLTSEHIEESVLYSTDNRVLSAESSPSCYWNCARPVTELRADVLTLTQVRLVALLGNVSLWGLLEGTSPDFSPPFPPPSRSTIPPQTNESHP